MIRLKGEHPLVGLKASALRAMYCGKRPAALALHVAQANRGNARAAVWNVLFHHVLDPIVGAFFGDADGDVVEDHGRGVEVIRVRPREGRKRFRLDGMQRSGKSNSSFS